MRIEKTKYACIIVGIHTTVYSIGITQKGILGMGYLFILLSVLANAVKGYCTKQVSNAIVKVRDAIHFNLIRNALCCVIAALFFFLEAESKLWIVTPAEFWICFISGGAMAALVVSWALAIKTDAYMLVTACASGSFIIPCILGLFLLNERFTLFKFVSFIAIIVALFFLLRYNFSIKGKLGKKQIFLLALVLVSQGLNQTMQKLYVHYITYKGASCYTLYSFIFATILLFFVTIFLKSPKDPQQHPLIRGNLTYIVLMSLGLFGASYFQTLAAASVDAIILYPMVNALSLIAGSVMANLFFKERISRDSVFGVIFVLAALIFSRL